MEVELHKGDALDVLTLDMVNAGNVEEVILVVVGQEGFHLLRVHAAVGLGHVDDRDVEIGEDVDLHARRGQAGPQDEGGDAHHHGDRVPQSKDDGIHR